jgi:hypothetical protein
MRHGKAIQRAVSTQDGERHCGGVGRRKRRGKIAWEDEDISDLAGERLCV